MPKFSRLSVQSLVLVYIALSMCVLAVFAMPLWYTWNETIEKGGVELLREDVLRSENIYRSLGIGGIARRIDQRVGSRLMGEKIVLLTDASFSKLAGNLPAWPDGLSKSTGIYKTSVTVDGESSDALLMHSILPDGYHLLMGRDVDRINALKTGFFYGLGGAVGIVVLVGVLGGLLIRRALLAEVHGIRQTATAIVDGDLSRRLPTRGTRDELDLLAQTVNRMLDQIEQLIHGVRNVSNAIAHDLRTPLTELRFRLEDMLLTRPVRDQDSAEIEAAVGDVDRVIGIFNALLRLAEIDTGARRSGFVRVDVAKVASEAVEFYQPLAELKGIRLSFRREAGAELAGDPLLLAQAIGNLIDNALKFARPEGAVMVEVTRQADAAIDLSVIDDGPGIPDDEKPKVTERFYRGDASRGTPGVGLGLSLVSVVAELHGGGLVLMDNDPGLRATLRLFSAAGG
jgi:signal transduction histidine kinase